MQKRLSLLLKLTAIFNLLFLLMVFNDYRLQGKLVGLPTTAVVGSSAIVLLAVLVARVRQPRQLASNAVFSPWTARFLLLLLPICFLVAIPLVVLWLVLLAIVRDLLPAIAQPVSLVVGSLLGILSGYVAIVVLFDEVAALVKGAALPKPIALVASTLQAVSLMLILAFVGTVLVALTGGSWGDLQCSQRYLSPSGQRAIVVEDYEIFGDIHSSSAYFDGTLLRKNLRDFDDDIFVCRDEYLKLKWSANERQVDWKRRDEQGRWQF